MNTNFSRRQFLRYSAAGVAGAVALPTIVPRSVFGANEKIQIAQLGCGRIARDMDLPGILKHDMARVIAVCDLDSKRLQDGKKFVEDYYARKQTQAPPVKTYGDYRQLLQ